MRAPFSCGRFGASSTTPCAHQSGKRHADRLQDPSRPWPRLQHLLADRLDERVGGQLDQRVLVVVLFGKATQLADQLVVHHQARLISAPIT